MWIINKLRNPIYLILGYSIKAVIRKIFFSKIENKDFNNLFSYTLELLPNETIINIIKLLTNTYKSKPSELFKTKILNEAMIHTLPQEERIKISTSENNNIKYLFIFLILGNIFKRSIFLVRNIILLPFKLGVYSFIAYLFGIKLDWLLSLFDIFKFNLPGWTYSKLVSLHISWMSWIKEIFKINSITTEFNSDSQIPKIKKPSINIELEPETGEINKPDTYLYLTKKEWIYTTVSIIFLLGAYFGYTGGIPFSKTFEWSSDNRDNDPRNEDSGNGGGGYLKGKRSLRTLYEHPRGLEFSVNDRDNNTWQDSFSNWTTRIVNKINPFNWFSKTSDLEELESRRNYEFWKSQQDELDRKYQEKLITEEENLKTRIWREQLERQGELSEMDREQLRKEYLGDKKSSPTHSDPEKAREYDQLFQYIDNKVKEKNTHITAFSDFKDKFEKRMEEARKLGIERAEKYIESVIKQDEIETPAETSNSRDSMETVRPLIKDNPPQIKPESNPEEKHTYPPQGWRTIGKIRRKSIRFSNLSNTPFARGFTEELDTSKPQPMPESKPESPIIEASNQEASPSPNNPDPSIEVEKGSLMFSSKFLDDINSGWN